MPRVPLGRGARIELIRIEVACHVDSGGGGGPYKYDIFAYPVSMRCHVKRGIEEDYGSPC